MAGHLVGSSEQFGGGEVTRKCGVEELGTVVRARQLRRFGHVERMDETDLW